MRNNWFIKTGITILLLMATIPSLHAQYDHSAAEKAGWRLASQAYTFRSFTFAETLDKLNEANIKYVEMYPAQQIGGGIAGTTKYDMDKETRGKIKDLLKQKNIQLVDYGVINTSDTAEWRKIFEFAKDMGIETILSEPKPELLPMIDRLANQYGINVALHNHPVPSYYWHPSVVLSALRGRSPRIGAAADFGHWVRSGLDPVECVKMLEGKIISTHTKDLNIFGTRAAHDVPWGTGICNLSGILHELKKQGFKGVFSVEYEYNWDHSLPEVKESARYFYYATSWLFKPEK
ncbi:MAG: sugar phosphate isomerase/epimerase [Prolixibacteraceae bacterium]|nr:sugar phosphate isomerase/epimerase [Prolixibacteraceae bacterium]